MRTKPNQLLLTLLLLCSAGWLAAQDTSEIKLQSVFDFLTQEEGAVVRLELDLDSLLDNRKNAEYQPARLITESGETFDLEVRTRGKFRRKRCEIPPIKIKFSKSMLLAENLDTLNEIKLVLPCADRSANEELIIREYIAYRMFETLSPEYCTRARLVQLHLKDNNRKRPHKMFALLVEHEEQVSARLHATVSEEWGVKPEELDTNHLALMTLFQYMIGNTDWETVSCRNVMLIQPADTNARKFVVPYDFDFSGLVSAPYASPSSESGVRTVQDRFLMVKANEVGEEALNRARGVILDHRKEMYDWCRDPNLSGFSRDQMVAFLDAFFEVLNTDAPIPVRLEYVRE